MADHGHTWKIVPEDEHLGMEHIICASGCNADYWQAPEDTGNPIPEEHATPEEVTAWAERRTLYR